MFLLQTLRCLYCQPYNHITGCPALRAIWPVAACHLSGSRLVASVRTLVLLTVYWVLPGNVAKHKLTKAEFRKVLEQMDAENCIENEIDFLVETDWQSKQDHIEESSEVPEINPELHTDVLTDWNILQEKECAMEMRDESVEISDTAMRVFITKKR